MLVMATLADGSPLILTIGGLSWRSNPLPEIVVVVGNPARMAPDSTSTVVESGTTDPISSVMVR